MSPGTTVASPAPTIETVSGDELDMLLSIGTHRTDSTVRLDLTGEIDMSTAASLSRAITEALDTGSDVVINLDGTTFCDCAGITALLNGRRDALARQAGYQVRNAHGNPLRILHALGLHSVLIS